MTNEREYTAGPVSSELLIRVREGAESFRVSSVSPSVRAPVVARFRPLSFNISADDVNATRRDLGSSAPVYLRPDHLQAAVAL